MALTTSRRSGPSRLNYTCKVNDVFLMRKVMADAYPQGIFFLSAHHSRPVENDPESRFILSESDGALNVIGASALRLVEDSVCPGVAFTVVLNGCASPTLVPFAKFHFTFVRPSEHHNANELFVALTSCRSDELSCAMGFYEEIGSG
ncbi:hypothetical protein A2U01_0036217, partial [Trifolium medium]|nr:hypothetical protein [Trifolium medium]